MTSASGTDPGEYFMPASAHTTEMWGIGLRRGCRGLPYACVAAICQRSRHIPATEASIPGSSAVIFAPDRLNAVPGLRCAALRKRQSRPCEPVLKSDTRTLAVIALRIAAHTRDAQLTHTKESST